MAQDYEVLQFKAGNFQDNFGNTWCDMALKGVGEPVRIVVKDPTAIHEGDTLYGEIKEMTSKAGKSYNRFYREQRPEGEDNGNSTGNPSGNKSNYVPRDDNAIRAQWAIGQAMSHFANKDKVKLPDVEVLAGALYEMVERVKDSTPSLKALESVSVEDAVAQAQARRDQQIIQAQKTGVTVPDEVITEFGDEPINLDDIPF